MNLTATYERKLVVINYLHKNVSFSKKDSLYIRKRFKNVLFN